MKIDDNLVELILRAMAHSNLVLLGELTKALAQLEDLKAKAAVDNLLNRKDPT